MSILRPRSPSIGDLWLAWFLGAATALSFTMALGCSNPKPQPPAPPAPPIPGPVDPTPPGPTPTPVVGEVLYTAIPRGEASLAKWIAAIGAPKDDSDQHDGSFIARWPSFKANGTRAWLDVQHVGDRVDGFALWPRK